MSDLIENENGRIGEIDAPASAREKTAGFDADVVENAEVGTSETPSFQDASYLGEYEQAGHGDKLIRLRGKEPVGRWRDLPSIGIDGGKSWTAKGGNVGFRMSETDWVIDIDPRRFPDGDDVLARNWLSVTDVIQRLGRARENRDQHARLLNTLKAR
jgi:hypothetical protein